MKERWERIAPILQKIAIWGGFLLWCIYLLQRGWWLIVCCYLALLLMVELVAWVNSRGER